MHRAGKESGFTMVELAVVLTIVALLLTSLMYTFSAQVDQRNVEETRRRLEQARELILSYAIVNGRLPCPSRCSGWPNCTTTSAEVRDATTGACTQGGVDDYYGGTVAAGPTMGGLLPAQTIGYQQVDPGGFALDAWGNRIRYAVAKLNTGCAVTPPPNTILFTHAANLKTYGVSCQPNDLLVCKSSNGITGGACGGAANQIMSQSLVVAIVFSTGKNGATSNASGPCPVACDEATNVKTNTTVSPTINPVFVLHPPTASDFVYGEFDDLMLWIPVGELYGRLISAGVLP
jgi:prepilin-type N-terminal cleavage/methylation domain-containing protein